MYVDVLYMHTYVCTTHARRAGAERERRRGGRGAGKHNTRRHMAYGRRETRRCEAMRSRRCEAMRGIQHGGGHTHGQDAGGWRRQGRRSRAGHDTINSGTKADAIRFKKRKQTDRNEHIRFAGSKVRYGTMIKFYRGL